MTPNFTYLNQPANRWTFKMPKVRRWVEQWARGKVLNLFAGMTVLDLDEIRVDISPDAICHHEADANDFVRAWADSPFDTVILDPPYNWRKAKEKYGGKMIGRYPQLKDDLLRIIAPGARVISFGWDSVGMSKVRGFDKVAIALVCHNGDHRDTVGLVEERISRSLLDGVE